MRQIILDGNEWGSADDVYDAFFKAVGAAEWHGRNFNAIRDSVVGGRINKIETPYLIKIKNYSSICAEVKKMADDFVALIKELHKSGSPADIYSED